MSASNDKTAHRNFAAISMNARHNQNTKMRDRRNRRAKDAKRSWKREEW